jgi:ABC-type branched-subunit amino acid transport system permease subunit
VFGAIVIAHLMRIHAEPAMAGEPWFWVLTLVAAALSGWAWWLFAKTRRAG